jgi:hypothetical protein
MYSKEAPWFVLLTLITLFVFFIFIESTQEKEYDDAQLVALQICEIINTLIMNQQLRILVNNGNC